MLWTLLTFSEGWFPYVMLLALPITFGTTPWSASCTPAYCAGFSSFGCCLTVVGPFCGLWSVGTLFRH